MDGLSILPDNSSTWSSQSFGVRGPSNLIGSGGVGLSTNSTSWGGSPGVKMTKRANRIVQVMTLLMTLKIMVDFRI